VRVFSVKIKLYIRLESSRCTCPNTPVIATIKLVCARVVWPKQRQHFSFRHRSPVPTTFHKAQYRQHGICGTVLACAAVGAPHRIPAVRLRRGRNPSPLPLTAGTGKPPRPRPFLFRALLDGWTPPFVSGWDAMRFVAFFIFGAVLFVLPRQEVGNDLLSSTVKKANFFLIRSTIDWLRQSAVLCLNQDPPSI
jgi:hypothetical protein